MKSAECFAAIPVVNFTVDVAAKRVDEETLVAGHAYDAPARHSHIRETVGYGSYLPKYVFRSIVNTHSDST